MAELIVLVVLPLLAAVLTAFVAPRIGSWVTIAAGAVSVLMVIPLIARTPGHAVRIGILRADALSTVFEVAIAFLYLVVGIYAHGYLAEERGRPERARFCRLLLAGVNLFAWSMLCAPLMDGLALLWVAVEITTIVSALLVAIEDTDGASEAAWKYVLIASSGLGIALLATIFMYAAGASVLGSSYDLAFGPLIAHAGALPDTPVRLAFVLAVVGFGTKVGLVPVHTWLPDAHAEAPTPVSALLSGALLAVSFYAILRYFEVARVALGPSFPQGVLAVFGVLSLLLAALYVLRQRDVKRLLAYSSVEHMGIIAIGASFGVPLAAAGVLLHVLAHAVAKGGAFMGAGVLVRAYGTKQVSRIRDALRVLPWTGPMFLLLILGLSGLPPAGTFRSELLVVAGGFRAHHGWIGGALVVLVTVAFFGIVVSVTRMVCAPGADTPPRGEPSRAMAVAVALCLLALLVLGVHPPDQLMGLITAASHQIAGGGVA